MFGGPVESWQFHRQEAAQPCGQTQPPTVHALPEGCSAGGLPCPPELGAICSLCRLLHVASLLSSTWCAGEQFLPQKLMKGVGGRSWTCPRAQQEWALDPSVQVLERLGVFQRQSWEARVKLSGSLRAWWTPLIGHRSKGIIDIPEPGRAGPPPTLVGQL